MNDLNTPIRRFFDVYEKANADFDVQQLAGCYADVFMFAGPARVQTVKKEDFLKVLPRRKEFFKSAGLVSSTIATLDVSKLDSKYAMVKIVWRMRFERSAGKAIDSEISATYILAEAAHGFEIIFQIDHQDLTEKVQQMRVG
ncbi:MAG: hypothetical protein JO356_17490 [Acidobacteria bacterium]|nr:hypothetical protein [Acidobacteriota bacterium]